MGCKHSVFSFTFLHISWYWLPNIVPYTLQECVKPFVVLLDSTFRAVSSVPETSKPLTVVCMISSDSSSNLRYLWHCYGMYLVLCDWNFQNRLICYLHPTFNLLALFSILSGWFSSLEVFFCHWADIFQLSQSPLTGPAPPFLVNRKKLAVLKTSVILVCRVKNIKVQSQRV